MGWFQKSACDPGITQCIPTNQQANTETEKYTKYKASRRFLRNKKKLYTTFSPPPFIYLILCSLVTGNPKPLTDKPKVRVFCPIISSVSSIVGKRTFVCDSRHESLSAHFPVTITSEPVG